MGIIGDKRFVTPEELYAWIKKRLEEEGYIITKKPSKNTDGEYWQFVKNRAWYNINFHYEILCKGNLLNANKLRLEAHLERKNTNSANKQKMIMEIFEVDKLPRGEKNPLFSEGCNTGGIPCDFTTVESAEATINSILTALHSDRLSKYVVMAERVLQHDSFLLNDMSEKESDDENQSWLVEKGKLEKAFQSFIDELQMTKKPRNNALIPEVFGIQYKEVYITKWLAYLLSIREDNMGIKVLNALIKASGKSLELSENEIVDVFTEYTFSDGRRIDILIRTKNIIIGIENKIYSSEQDDQTHDYKVSIERLVKKEKKSGWVGIYLRPDQNTSISQEFVNVTYGSFNIELRESFPSVKGFCDRQQMYIQDFIQYVEEYFMNDFPEMSKEAQLFAKYLPDIQEAQNGYEEYLKQIKR